MNFVYIVFGLILIIRVPFGTSILEGDCGIPSTCTSFGTSLSVSYFLCFLFIELEQEILLFFIIINCKHRHAYSFLSIEHIFLYIHVILHVKIIQVVLLHVYLYHILVFDLDIVISYEFFQDLLWWSFMISSLGWMYHAHVGHDVLFIHDFII